MPRKNPRPAARRKHTKKLERVNEMRARSKRRQPRQNTSEKQGGVFGAIKRFVGFIE